VSQEASEWISHRQAAKILGVSESLVYRSLATPERADRWWGPGNWRIKPLSERGDRQVRASRAHELATSSQPLQGASADQTPDGSPET